MVRRKPEIYANRRKYLEDLQTAIESMHKHVVALSVSYDQRTFARNTFAWVVEITSKQKNWEEPDTLYRHNSVVPSDRVGVIMTKRVRMKEAPMAFPRYRSQATCMANPRLSRLTGKFSTNSLGE